MAMKKTTSSAKLKSSAGSKRKGSGKSPPRRHATEPATHRSATRATKPTPRESAKKSTRQGSGDFGVRPDDTVERDYVSANTKRSDRGAAMPRSGESETEGQRVSGAGGTQSGVGSSSGGDLDPDIIGVGTGGTGVATNPSKEHNEGPDDTDGSSAEFAAGGPARGENQTGVHKIGGNKRVRGSTVSGADDRTASGPSDDASMPPGGDQSYGDAFSGEVSGGEARGDDEAGR